LSVSVRYAPTPAGSPYSLPENAGTLSPGDQSSVINTYISHDGTVKISDCAIYILPYSAGVYLGAGTAQDDYNLLIGWGDSSYPASSGGGLYVNMNHAGGFPSGDWAVFRTGVGDSIGNAITLTDTAISTGLAATGEIQAGGEAHLRWRLDVPASYTGTGIGYIDTLMYYTSTS
jgi:hypothetical protein